MHTLHEQCQRSAHSPASSGDFSQADSSQTFKAKSQIYTQENNFSANNSIQRQRQMIDQ
jgi:predicted S18 family serine protease